MTGFSGKKEREREQAHNVVHAQGGASRQEKGRASVRVRCLSEQLNLALQGKVAAELCVLEHVQAQAHLAGVFFDDLLGAHQGFFVQVSVPDTTQVPVQACKGEMRRGFT